jgi:hypothetical protein
MLKRVAVLGLLFLLAALVFSGFRAVAQNKPLNANVPVTTVVTVLGPKFTAPPPLTKEDIIVFQGKDRLNVTGWTGAQGERGALQLAILIDNSVSTTLGSQFNDLRSFIVQQPRNTSVGIFYALNGTVQIASNFDKNHEAVSKKLRLPLGRAAGNSPSIYLSLADLIKHHWPAPPGVRREALVISSGVDLLNPGVQDPYFESTLDTVQRAGVVVHTIYAGGTRFGSSFNGDISQGKLVQLTSESGGQGFFQALSTPISFAPYLSQLDMVLRNQYLLTFEAPRSSKAKGELRPIKITTEQRNAQISAPSEVFIPGRSK